MLQSLVMSHNIRMAQGTFPLLLSRAIGNESACNNQCGCLSQELDIVAAFRITIRYLHHNKVMVFPCSAQSNANSIQRGAMPSKQASLSQSTKSIALHSGELCDTSITPLTEDNPRLQVEGHSNTATKDDHNNLEVMTGSGGTGVLGGRRAPGDSGQGQRDDGKPDIVPPRERPQARGHAAGQGKLAQPPEDLSNPAMYNVHQQRATDEPAIESSNIDMASNYIGSIQTRFLDQPDVYENFLKIMKDS
jgi:hypothetical protein